MIQSLGVILAMGILVLGSRSLAENNNKTTNSDRQEETRKVFKHSMPKVKSCYENGLKLNPKLAGKVVTQFKIDALGKVRETSIVSSTLHDPAVEGCILKQLSQQQFPKPPDGTNTVIEFPFVFDSKK